MEQLQMAKEGYYQAVGAKDVWQPVPEKPDRVNTQEVAGCYYREGNPTKY